MTNISRAVFALLFSLSLFTPMFAQTRRPSEQTSGPIVTVTTSNGRVRYASLGEVNQTRLQVFSQEGSQVYDSEYRLGNLIDWPLLDQQGQRLTNGTFLFLITVRDFSAVVTQKYGTALLENDQVALQQVGRDELLPAQALALQANKLSAVLSPVDRIGSTAAAVPATAANDRGAVVDPVPQVKLKEVTISQPTPLGESVTGTGAQNTLPKWTDNAGTLGDSSIYGDASGNVGIGLTGPELRTHILGTSGLPATSGTAQNGALRVQGANGNSVLDIGADSFSSGSGWLQSTNRTNLSLTYPLLLNPRGGNLGIGIATTPGPELRTHILGTSGLPVTSGTAQNGALRIQGASGNSVLDIGADSSSTGNEWLQSTNRTNLGLTYPLLLNPRGGNVGIGTVTPTAKLDVNGDLNVTGNAVVSGNIAAKYQDVAEWVQARQLLAAGTVVSLDGTLTNAVAASRRAYDTHVAGVVSTQPGVILGEGGPGRVLVSTTGRLRVKVDASRYPIRIGDLLVSSNKPGVAMRSKPIRIGGKLIHRPGTIIGKALEALPNGSGEILVLVSLQ